MEEVEFGQVGRLEEGEDEAEVVGNENYDEDIEGFGADDEEEEVDEEINDSEADSDDEEAGKWKFVYEKKPEDVNICFDPIQRFSFEHFEREVKEMLKAFRVKIGARLDSKLNLVECLDYWVRPYALKLQEHVNEIANRKQDRQGVVSLQDVLNFIHFEVVVSIYQTSPTLLFKRPESYPLSKHLISKELYFKILQALSKQKYEQGPATFDKGIEEMETMIAELCSVLFVEGHTIIALDDDKLAGSPRLCKYIGLNVKKIKKNFGPVNHYIASVLTGVYLGGTLERNGDRVSVIIERLLSSHRNPSVRTPRGPQGGTEHTKENLLTNARGYNMKQTSKICQDCGVHELGTRKKETNFAFTFGSREAKDGQKKIDDAGHSAAYWATLESPFGEGSKKMYGTAWKANGRVAMIQTTLEEANVFKWAYVTRGLRKEVKAWDARGVSQQIRGRVAQLVDQVKHHVRLLTVAQASPEWFLLRRFRITSSVSGKIVFNWFKTRLRPLVHNLPEGDEKTYFTQSIPYVENILFATASGDSSQSDIQDEETQELYSDLMVLKKTELQRLCRTKIDASKHWGQNKGALCTKLIESGIVKEDLHMVHQPSYKQILHDAWFMTPFERKQLNIGRENESRVVKWIPKFMKTKTPYDVLKYVHLGLFTHKDHDFIATSVDGLCVLGNREKLGEDIAENDDSIFNTFVEIKTRSGTSAVEKIERLAGNLESRFIEIDLADPSSRTNFKKYVSSASYRMQVLHHAISGGIDRVLYVEATTKKIEYCVLVSIPFVLRDCFIKTLYIPINHRFIAPLKVDLDAPYNGQTAILQKHGIEPGYAHDELTYRQAYLLNVQLTKLGLATPLPPAQSIVPRVINYWNNLKGGVDVFSRLVKNIMSTHPRLNFIGRFNVRTLSILLMNAHLLIRLDQLMFDFRGNDVGLSSEFKTNKQVKNKLNNMGSFKDFLHDCQDSFQALKERALRAQASSSIPLDTDESEEAPVSVGSRPNKRKSWTSPPLTTKRLKKNVNHIVSRTTDSNVMLCILCCSLCAKNKHQENGRDSARRGYRVRTGCISCAAHTSDDMVPLCNLPRFKHLQGTEYEDLTCFQIHHKCKEYPTLPCSK